MKKSFLIPQLILLCPLLFAACTEHKKSPQIERISPDFIVQTLGEDTPTNFEVDPDCDAQMAKALCVSDSAELGYDQNCSFEKVTLEQLAALRGVTRELPPFHKKVMCHLSRIQIQDGIFSIAYATGIRDSSRKPIGNMIGLRAEVLDKKIAHRDLLSWKEQLNFGLTDPKDPERKYSPDGIRVVEELPEGYSAYMPSIIHELNHLIDFMNAANDVDWNECTDDPNDAHLSYCKHTESSFARLSWGEHSVILSRLPGETNEDLEKVPYPAPVWTAQWPLVGKLCFYYCTATQPLDAIVPTYTELGKTNFTTSYSSQSEMEDFAEAATYYALHEIGIPFRYKIVNAQGQVYFDGYQHFLSDTVKTKREWLKDFFAKDLSYSIK